MTNRDRLPIVCTDRGTHQPRELGLILWQPDLSHGSAVWSPDDDVTRFKPHAVATNTRPTRDGQRVRERSPVQEFIRTDGGTTFRFPECPTCKRPREVRDDTAAKVLRAGTLTRLDVSLSFG